MTQPITTPRDMEDALRRHALSYPETSEEFPWGHSAIKVRGKAFLFMGCEDGTFSLSVKLPHSRDLALMLPFATPTGYGLGKSGWVSAKFHAGAALPLDMLEQWIDESYRAIAPKKLVASLGTPAPAEPAARKPAAKASATRKPTARKPAAKPPAARRTRP